MSVRAIEFLEYKFGKDRRNGHNIAKLLEEYRNWEPSVDTDNLDVVNACDEMGIRTNSRKQPDVDARMYISVYCYVYRDMSVGDISKMFGRHHSSISVLIDKFEDRLNDSNFNLMREYISGVYRFNVNNDFAVSVINRKRR